MPSLLKQAHERATRISKLAGGSILVGLSGKDSFATLDILAQHFDRIECFNMYFVRGLRCLEAPLEATCARYKVKLHFVPHYDVARMLKHAVFRSHIRALRDTPQIKKGDCEALARKRSGIEWIAYGERLSDSFSRRLFWRKIDGIYPDGKRCAPIMEWLDADVRGYMRARKLCTPCTFGQTSRSTDFALTREVLTWLQQHHPDDFDRVLRVFPAAVAQTL